MKKFKKIDTWVSILLIIVFAIAALINRDYTFLAGYFVGCGFVVGDPLRYGFPSLVFRQLP